MRPTSDPDSDFHDPDDRRPHDVITDDGDPSLGPWAQAPAHLRDDEREDERPDEHPVGLDNERVPAQREPDHDGQLYVAATHPDNDLTDDQAEHHEPVPVDEAGEPIDDTDRMDTDRMDTDRVTADHDGELATRDDEPAQDHRLDRIEISHDEPVAHDEPVMHDDVARDDEPVALHETAGPLTSDEPFASDEPAPVVAVPADTDGTAEPTADTDHDGGLKPGDVPVSVVAFLAEDAVDDLRQRWREAQLGFVDDPRQAAEDVRNLVNQAIEKVTAALHSQREQFGDAPSGDTEHYRVTVQRCRAFFDRLLSL